MDEILKSFPRADNQDYDLHISHTACKSTSQRYGYILIWTILVVESIFERIPEDRHRTIMTILDHSKSSLSQKRVLLMNQGLNRALIDEIELLLDPGECL